MIRTHMIPCHLPRAEADALSTESGRVYTLTLVWHYRIYRRKGIWLSQGAAEKLGDFMSQTTLHAHSPMRCSRGSTKPAKRRRHASRWGWTPSTRISGSTIARRSGRIRAFG